MPTLTGIASGTRIPNAMYPNTPGSPSGNISQTGNTALLGNDPALSTVDSYGALLRSDNPLLAMARGNAMDYAAAMGAGVDSASYGYNAERGMAAQLQPLVQQDAAQRLALEQGNQDALNRMALARESTRATLGAANINAASAMDQLRYRAARDAEERAQNRAWTLEDQDTQARASARSQFMGHLEDTIFSDPAYWRDPQAAMGFMQEYGDNFDQWFRDNFPEYFDNPAGGTP